MLSTAQTLQLARCLPLLRQHYRSPARELKHRHAMSVSLLSTETVKLKEEIDGADEFTVTKDEAISYVENILQIQDPCKFAETQRYNFLCEVQRRTRITQPFSTVHYLQDPSDIRCPNKDEIKMMMFKKHGGGCIQINPFTMAVLRQFGYKAYTVCATLPKERANSYQAHVGLVVKDVTEEGSTHLVEPGTRHSILDPISLDFKRASPVYQLMGYPIKLFRDCPGIVKLCMPISKAADVKRDANLYHDEGQMWRGMITYRVLEFKSWDYCYQMADILTKNAALIPDVHKDLVIFGYDKDLLWTIFKGKTFFQYDKNGRETSKQFITFADVIKAANERFPQYSREALQSAIGYTETASKHLLK